MNPGLRALCSTFAIWLVAGSAFARREGYHSTDCRGCHAGDGDVEFTIEFEPEQPDPGDLVTLTVTVNAEAAAVAGIAIASNGLGGFGIPEGESLRTEDIWVTHIRPKPAADGVVQFRVEWQAPSEPGIADFNVAVVAANGNGAPTGDATRSTLIALPFGCDVVDVYTDADGDGHGDPERPAEVACSAAQGYAAAGDDCDDQNPNTYPGAAEQCNDIDDDCDGEVDQDVIYRPYYFDNDHDGFGNVDIVIDGCALPEGAVENALDCDDFERDVSPGSPELCDQQDNDCNGLIDDNACPAPQRCVDGACVDTGGTEGGATPEIPASTPIPDVSPSVSAPTADDVPAVTPSSSDAADAPTSSSAVPSSADDTSGVASNPQSSAADNPDSPDATSGCAMHNPARSRSGALGLLVGVVSLVLVARRSRNLVARHSSGFAALDASTSRGHAEAPVTPESPSTLARGRFGGHG